MRSFLEPIPKFGVTPFFKLIYFVRVFLYTYYEFGTTVKNRRTAENADVILDLVSY